jgi:hypothetical protein
MHSVAIASLMFVCVFGGALVGLWLGARLPAEHLERRTQELVKLGMGTIATLMALVLGLLVATAKASFDTTATQTKQFAAKLVQLDHVLERYGDETVPTRRLLKRYLAHKIEQLWPEGRRSASVSQGRADAVLLETAGDQLLSLRPHNDVQKALLSRAMQLASDLEQTRWLLVEQTAGSSIPTPFLIILGFWATTLFVSFGMFAPRHGTSIGVLFVCALSIAAAIFVILEMDHPFSGMIRIPSAPARSALANMR